MLTEFALLPYDAQAPLHVKGIITPKAKYATYTHWRSDSAEPLTYGEEAELYDYTTHAGYHEIDNLAGRSQLEDQLRATLGQATLEELHAPLPFTLVEAQRRGLAEYHRLAVAERMRSSSTTACTPSSDRREHRARPALRRAARRRLRRASAA